jgi:hypothetical protein
MHDLSSANAYQDAQHFNTGHSLRQLSIEAGSTLFNKGKVETCRIADCLREVSNATGLA